MSTFSNLKKSSGSFDKLQKAVETLNTGKNYEAENATYFKLTRDKAGNASAVIRFLSPPEQDGEDALPWARYFAHGFQGPGGKWYIENCPTTLNHDCPACESNSALWATGDKTKKEVASSRKRKLNYVSNVYVVADPANPENNGKVFKFRYGTKIHDKLLAAMNPPDPIDPSEPKEPAIDAFDMFEHGANFKLVLQTVKGIPNYDNAKFSAPSRLAKTDKEIEEIWKQCYSLTAVVAEDQFKSHEELTKKLNMVLGESTAPKTVEQARNVVNNLINKQSDTSPADIPWDTDGKADNDPLAMFKELTEED